jgi:uncharacterized protein YfeS
MVSKEWGMDFWQSSDVTNSHDFEKQLVVFSKNEKLIASIAVQSDQVVIAAAFGQIKITGCIEPELKKMALQSLKRFHFASIYFEWNKDGEESPFIIQMTADLLSF